MKILVVCHYGLYQDFTYSFVHRQIREYVRLGHQVRVLIPIAFFKQGVTHHRVFPTIMVRELDGAILYYLRFLSLSTYGIGGFNTASALWMLRHNWRRIMENFAPDVIHAHTLGLDSELGAWIKTKTNCPLVVTTHGSDTSVPFNKGNFMQIKDWCEKADTVVTVSFALRQKIEACHLSCQTQTIYNGFNANFLKKGLSKRPLSMVQVGGLTLQKRTHCTICAFAKVHKKHPEANLTIIGEGPQRLPLETLCKTLQITKDVTFLGQISNNQVFSEMEKAQFFCMPSVDEGFGIVYLEAMASGCCTIGTEGEGIADLIVSGKNGFLVPPDDVDAIVSVIEKCLQNPTLFSRITLEGRKTAKTLTWEHNAWQYIALFNALDEGKRDNGSMDCRVEK